MLVAIFTIAMVLCAAMGFSYAQTQKIEADHPNSGERLDVGGYRLNSVHIARPAIPDLPPIVFLHGASGNLQDQMIAFGSALRGRAEMLFVDRPGHGYSERGGVRNSFPDGQADAIATLMEKRGIRQAIIAGHSFGGAIALSFALNHPEKTAGLLLLAPVTHPWPGGIDWYYTLASTPFVGRLFTNTVTLPLGLMRIDIGTQFVFHPNTRPEGYIERTGPALVLRPKTFRHNAVDIANLNAYVSRIAPRYNEIVAPTVIITGDSDTVVSADIHSRHLARNIPGADLVLIRGVGHKPEYIATDVAIAALEKLAGKPRDLESVVAAAEIRIAAQAKLPLSAYEKSASKTAVKKLASLAQADEERMKPKEEATSMQIGSATHIAVKKPIATDAVSTSTGLMRADLEPQQSSVNQALAYIKKSGEAENGERVARAKQKLEDAKAQLEFLRRWSFSPEVVARQAAALGQQVAAAANDFAASGDLMAPDAAVTATTANSLVATTVSVDAAEEDGGDSIAQQAYLETMQDGMERSTPSSEERDILADFKSLAEEIRRLLQEALRKMQQEKNAERAGASDAIAALGDQIGKLTAILGATAGSAATTPTTFTL